MATSKLKGLELLYNTLVKRFALESAKKKGSNVVDIGPEIQELVNKEYIKYIKAFENAGVDIDKLSPSDIKFTIELNEANKLRKKEGIEKALVSTDNVVDMKNQKLDPNKPIMGGTQSEEDILQKSIKKNIDEATEKGDFRGIANQVLRDPEIAKAFKEAKEAEALANERALQTKPIPLDTIQYQGPDIQKMTGPEKQKYLITDDKQTAELLKRGYTFDDIIYAQDNYGLTAKEIMEEAKGATKKDPFPFQSGGRAGFKMGRRAFLKLIGGVGAGIGALKSGMLNLIGKEAAPQVAKEVVEQTTKSTPPPYFFELANKIKSLGKPDKVTYADRVEIHRYTGKNGDEYELVEDLSTGDMKITKDKLGSAGSGEETYEGVMDRSVLEYKKGDVNVDPDRKIASKSPDEYDEYKVEFDVDGTEAEADDISEFIKKEIIEEVNQQAPKIKKASGGVAYMLGE
jgi:hypothetical protein